MPTRKKTNVDSWIQNTTSQQANALEESSRSFDKNDALTVNTLEAIYGKESSFGTKMRTRGMSGAAGHFQFEKKTAERFGLTVSKTNDQRFNVTVSADAMGKYLKSLDNAFSKTTHLGVGINTIPVHDKNERENFDIAAFNAGEGRIAQAQTQARKAGKNPKKWDDVKNFLKQAGATPKKVKEITDYVEKVKDYKKEFSKKSPLKKELKGKKPGKDKVSKSDNCHWITKNDRHVCIE